MSLFDNTSANGLSIRPPIFDGCADRWCCSMVGCWGKEWCHVGMWGSLIACRTTFCTTRGGENWSLLAVTQELLARIRVNQNSANDTAFAIVCVMPQRWDMYRFPRSRGRNYNVGHGPPRHQCEWDQRFSTSVLLYSVEIWTFARSFFCERPA
jgi:hypothetical protein